MPQVLRSGHSLTGPRLAAAAALLLLSACNSAGPADLGPAPELPSDTDYPLTIVAEAPGTGSATVSVTLTNEGAVDIGYNLCIDGHLERYTAKGWVAVNRDQAPCPLILLGLPPGGSAQSNVAVPTGAPAGTYRVRVDARVLRTNAPVIRRSNLIAVQP